MVGLILLTGLSQFVLGFLIDKCRNGLFNVIKIKKISNRIGDVIDTMVNKANKWAGAHLGINDIQQ